MEALDPIAAATRLAEFALLDVRAPSEFVSGHLASSGNLAPCEFEARRAELPPRDAQVLVLAGSSAEASDAARALESLGYALVAWLDAPLSTLAGGLDSVAPGARMWRPSPFLVRVLPRLARAATGPTRALDLAAGSGREAVFLALHGFEVEAWDRAPEALARARQLAQQSGVSIETRECDLEWRAVEIPKARYQLVTVFRFLHRALFPKIEAALAPGGMLVYETFRSGQERFGRPTHARFLLRPGELAHAFPSLDVLVHEEPDLPEGPVVARLLARRPESAIA